MFEVDMPVLERFPITNLWFLFLRHVLKASLQKFHFLLAFDFSNYILQILFIIDSSEGYNK